MNRKKLSITLAALTAALIVAIAAVFVAGRRTAGRGDIPFVAISEKTGVAIGQVHHTAVRDGITEWRLDAESAEYLPASGQVMFEKLTALFFVDENRTVKLTADRGMLQKDTNDIEVTGNVLVMDGTFRLKTVRLRYDHGARIISAPAPVEVKTSAWDLTADSMSMDLETRKTRFEGKVKGIFDEMPSL